MPNHRNPSQPSDSAGTLGKLSRLKHNTGASIGELREFMTQMRGKSPKEMLGILTQSELVRATFTATIGAAVLLVVFTVLPMLLGGDEKPKAASVQPVANQPAQPSNDNTKAATNTQDDKTAKPKKEDVAKKLGIDETKTADPKKNPLDDLGSDLFKDIK